LLLRAPWWLSAACVQQASPGLLQEPAVLGQG
jgi:hypothetical protein